MKKILCTLFMVGFMLNSFAQLTVFHDTVSSPWPKDGVSHILKDSFMNSSGAVMTINWTKTNELLLSGWSAVGICDPVTCYPYPATGNYTFTLNPGEKQYMYVDVKAMQNAADGNNYITVKLNDGVSDHNITFKMYSWATQIKDIENNNVVSVYPNPANNFMYLNILDSKVSGINVVNIIGKRLSHFDIDASTPNPMRVPLDMFSKGIYMLQFTDANGKLMGVKRVTKQ
jgi:hypothetical protein